MNSSGVERRLTIRMLSYWEKLRKERAMPRESDIDPDDLADLWDSCFLIHVRDLDKPDYNYTYLGQDIIDAYKHGLSDDDAVGLCSPNAQQLAVSFKEIIDTKTPRVEEGQFTNVRQETVKFRQCLLPLGEDGRVDAILGGMRFKIFSHE